LKKESKMQVHVDCKYYLGFKPCIYHKSDGRLCDDCTDYHRIEQKILIIKLDALGDVLRTTSILPAIHMQYPQSAITWVTRKNAIQLLENNPLIYRILAVEELYLQYVLNEKFDVGICLDSDPISATILSLADCTIKYGFVTNKAGQVIPATSDANNWYLMGLNDGLKKANRQTYQRIIYDICKLDGATQKPQLYLDDKTRQFSNAFSQKLHFKQFKKIIGINTGGGNRWQYKKWILDYYIQLIKLLNSNHPDIGILLLGGPEEIEFNQLIVENSPATLIDTGCKNTIFEFAALISLTDIFLTPDSLGMHIGIALDKISIVLVGPTSPWELDVYEKGEIVYNTGLDCISCYLTSCDKKINCMSTLAPETIFQLLERYL
jgi:ADP-heptose:LPS heptosyltransferase